MYTQADIAQDEFDFKLCLPLPTGALQFPLIMNYQIRNVSCLHLIYLVRICSTVKLNFMKNCCHVTSSRGLKYGIFCFALCKQENCCL